MGGAIVDLSRHYSLLHRKFFDRKNRRDFGPLAHRLGTRGMREQHGKKRAPDEGAAEQPRIFQDHCHTSISSWPMRVNQAGVARPQRRSSIAVFSLAALSRFLAA